MKWKVVQQWDTRASRFAMVCPNRRGLVLYWRDLGLPEAGGETVLQSMSCKCKVVQLSTDRYGVLQPYKPEETHTEVMHLTFSRNCEEAFLTGEKACMRNGSIRIAPRISR